jgi:hypothetical protein
MPTPAVAKRAQSYERRTDPAHDEGGWLRHVGHEIDSINRHIFVETRKQLFGDVGCLAMNSRFERVGGDCEGVDCGDLSVTEVWGL